MFHNPKDWACSGQDMPKNWPNSTLKKNYLVESITDIPLFLLIDPSTLPSSPWTYHTIVCIHVLCIYVYKFLNSTFPLLVTT